jgi:hypothetical protein
MICAAVLLACNKEAALTPSVPENIQLLPQGNNSYDDSIMASYTRYTTYILYRFNQLDFGYNHIEIRKDSAFNANPAYISPVLRLLHEHLFNFLPEDFLKKTMPYKILLASYIGKGQTRDAKGFATTYASLTIGWTDSTLNSINTPALLKQFRVNLIRFYMERAYRARAITIPLGFALLEPNGYASLNSVALKNQNGIIEPTGTALSLHTDFLGYVQAIATRSATDLENTYFHPNVDVKGMYRKKYNTVVNYFKSVFGFDLQALGNTF